MEAQAYDQREQEYTVHSNRMVPRKLKDSLKRHRCDWQNAIFICLWTIAAYDDEGSGRTGKAAGLQLQLDAARN